MDWINQIHCGDVLELLKKMPKEFVDMVITSPPYWSLRDYGIENQIGLEKHPQEYIDKIVKVSKEIKRVLKKSGSFYLNLGDTYCGSGMGSWDVPEGYTSKQVYYLPQGKARSCRVKYDGKWLQPKQLMLIPSRVAVALQEQGWCLRNDIIWHKPNAMPTSVKDRLNNTYEHLFHFVKSKKYYYDLDKVRVPHKTESVERACRGISAKGPWAFDTQKENVGYDDIKGKLERGELRAVHSSGKNPGDFWSITTKGFKDAHFAVFPPELIENPIKSSCPKDGIVLDPFCGSGTACLVAKQLGRKYIGIDINPEYVEMAKKRILKETTIYEWL